MCVKSNAVTASGIKLNWEIKSDLSSPASELFIFNPALSDLLTLLWIWPGFGTTMLCCWGILHNLSHVQTAAPDKSPVVYFVQFYWSVLLTACFSCWCFLRAFNRVFSPWRLRLCFPLSCGQWSELVLCRQALDCWLWACCPSSPYHRSVDLSLHLPHRLSLALSRHQPTVFLSASSLHLFLCETSSSLWLLFMCLYKCKADLTSLHFVSQWLFEMMVVLLPISSTLFSIWCVVSAAAVKRSWVWITAWGLSPGFLPQTKDVTVG